MVDPTTLPESHETAVPKARVTPYAVRRIFRWTMLLAVLAVVLFVISGPISLAQTGSCGSCHATQKAYSDWRASSHSYVRCVSCHTERGSLGGVGNSFALAQDVVRTVIGTSGAAVAVQDRACTACHPPAELAKPTLVKGLRISHSGLTEGGYRCTDCHAGVAHSVPVARISAATMSVCARCHNNVKLSGKCSLCHAEAKSTGVVSRSDPEWSKTHGRNWRTMHGMGDLSTCTLCHTPQMCQRCHGVPLPHDTSFIAEHGASALKARTECLNCHNQSFCDDCHGMPVPHPVGFLASHPKIAKGVQDPRCARCHLSDDCLSCHEDHTHPHGPGVGPAIPR